MKFTSRHMISDTADALFSVGYTRLGDVGNLVSKYAEQLAVAKAASAEGETRLQRDQRSPGEELVARRPASLMISER